MFELGQYYSVMAKYHKDDFPPGVSVTSAYLTASISAVESYILSVRYGHEHLMQALPKLLTMWFSIAALRTDGKNGSSRFKLICLE